MVYNKQHLNRTEQKSKPISMNLPYMSNLSSEVVNHQNREDKRIQLVENRLEYRDLKLKAQNIKQSS